MTSTRRCISLLSPRGRQPRWPAPPRSCASPLLTSSTHQRAGLRRRDALRRLARLARDLALPGGARRTYVDRSRETQPVESRGFMLSFQQLILRLNDFWDRQGCVLLQPYDMEMGAGTFHTATFLRAIGPEPWKAAYVQPSRRPKDGRYGENPNRLQHYYQYQVVLKP